MWNFFSSKSRLERKVRRRKGRRVKRLKREYQTPPVFIPRPRDEL